MITKLIVFKLLGMLTLSLGSYIIGILPVCFGLTKESAKSLLLSVFLCFGGGVLLSTSFLHILPESRELLPSYADVVFCCGYFLLYLVDELVKLNTKVDSEEDEHLIRHNPVDPDASPSQHNNQIEGRESVHSKSRFGILLAVSVHSVIEGSAIGVQTLPEKVLLLVSAVASHKLVVAFCLGIELSCNRRTLASLYRYMFIFSVGSSMGIILGMFVDPADSLFVPVLQALAAGSLLYVAVSEVLPRERARFKSNDTPRLRGIYQFVSLVSGFALICAFDVVL